MKEYEVREVIGKLWRNNPPETATFNPCKTEGCSGSTRDVLCDACIIYNCKGDNALLGAVLHTIKEYNNALFTLIAMETGK